MDKIDLELLSILSSDARMPFSKIAKTLGVGSDTIYRRFKKLEQKGIILGSTIILSSKACGFQGLCGLYLKLKSGSDITRVSDKLRSISEISNFIQIIGFYDFYIEAFFKDFKEIAALVTTLRSIDSVMFVDPMLYTLDDWSMPFISTYENGIPIWTYPIYK
jgi:Lrp/AsnC family transcriptional regulator for asnA, asnC and gidA